MREQAERGEWRAGAFRRQSASVLDHRTWFPFRLCGGRREWTDQVWAAGSASERALRVLRPLFGPGQPLRER